MSVNRTATIRHWINWYDWVHSMSFNPFARRKSVALPIIDQQTALSMSTLPTLLSSQPPLPPHSLPTPPASPILRRQSGFNNVTVIHGPGDVSVITTLADADISEKSSMKFMDRPMIKLFKDDVIAIYKFLRTMDWKEFGRMALKRSMYSESIFKAKDP